MVKTKTTASLPKYLVMLDLSRLLSGSLLNHAIKQSNKNGQMDRILTKWAAKLRADGVSGSEFESMGIENIISAFVIVGVAVIISLLVFSFEVFRRKKGNVEKPQLKEAQSSTKEDSRLLCEECKKCVNDSSVDN